MSEERKGTLKNIILISDNSSLLFLPSSTFCAQKDTSHESSSISLMIEIKWKIHSIGIKMFVFLSFLLASSLSTRTTTTQVLTSFFLPPSSHRRSIVAHCVCNYIESILRMRKRSFWSQMGMGRVDGEYI